MEDQPFEIRRRASLYAAVALFSAILALLFGLRAAADPDQWVLWLVVVLFTLIAYVHAIAIIDSRTPLFVADSQGVRMRNGNVWAGIRWEDMGDIRVERREGWRHDPRVKVVSGDGSYVFTSPLGVATTASPAQAEVQLTRRRPLARY